MAVPWCGSRVCECMCVAFMHRFNHFISLLFSESTESAAARSSPWTCRLCEVGALLKMFSLRTVVHPISNAVTHIDVSLGQFPGHRLSSSGCVI